MKSESARNISFGGEPVEFLTDSPHLIVFDPLALDILGEYSQEHPPESSGVLPVWAQRVHKNCLAGLYEIANFRPGRYRFDLRNMQVCNDVDDSHPEALKLFSTDSGAFIIAGCFHLQALTACFNWEKYDLALRTPVGDYSGFLAVNEAIGGPYYALIECPGIGSGTVFEGDGTYRLSEGAIQRVDSG